jgi:ABC-type lipoprotein export system ATPase subunit
MTSGAHTNVIELSGLTKSYHKGAIETPVLHDLSLTIARGEFVAITGASGCGKSTLMNILGLLDQPDGGSYRLDGTDYSQMDDDARSLARNQRIGFVFQQFHLMDRATAKQNVMLPLLYAEDETLDGGERAVRALEDVGLSHRANHLPSELSGGEQQRVAIARALINDPALILADEPTGNLDARSGAEVLEILKRLHSAGRTIVLVTHERRVADEADRVLVMQDGRLSATGSW